MIYLKPGQGELLGNKVHRFARCWKLTRKDSTVFYFTEHDKPIILDDGNTYTPVGGFSASAVQKQSALNPPNFEIVGLLNSSYITFEDLRTGKYDNAELYCYLVDWQYPWVGAWIVERYWIASIHYTGEVWEAQLEGLTKKLASQVGTVYNRTCRHVLGDAICSIVLSSYQAAGTVTGIDQQRNVIVDSGLTGAGAYYYDFGFLVWTSGNNNGETTEVKTYDTFTGRFTFYIPTYFDIQVGDTFTVYAGCDKVQQTCIDKYNNIVNFGGFPWIPGPTKMIETPAR